jgi:hypothetical protein
MQEGQEKDEGGRGIEELGINSRCEATRCPVHLTLWTNSRRAADNFSGASMAT